MQSRPSEDWTELSKAARLWWWRGGGAFLWLPADYSRGFCLFGLTWKWNRILANLADNPRLRPSKQLLGGVLRDTIKNGMRTLNYSEAT